MLFKVLILGAPQVPPVSLKMPRFLCNAETIKLVRLVGLVGMGRAVERVVTAAMVSEMISN